MLIQKNYLSGEYCLNKKIPKRHIVPVLTAPMATGGSRDNAGEQSKESKLLIKSPLTFLNNNLSYLGSQGKGLA